MCKQMPCIPPLGSNIPIHLQSVCRSIVFCSVCITLLRSFSAMTLVIHCDRVKGICAVIAIRLRLSDSRTVCQRTSFLKD